jgi:excisionase family DNA binding protein
MITVSQAAQLLGVHPNTVRNWSDNGLIKSYRLGNRRDRRFRLEDVIKLKT